MRAVHRASGRCGQGRIWQAADALPDKTPREADTPSRRWPRWAEALLGLAIGAGLLAVLTYWFAFADRHVVFLYAHVDHPGDLPAQPFDHLTRSRYWMTSLVAEGVVLLLGIGGALLGARRALALPDWRALWLWAAPLLLLGIPTLTLGVNAPVLDLPLVVAVTAVALAGLALALLPLSWAAVRPLELAILAAQGAGLGLPMLGWRAVELPGLGVLSPVIAGLVVAGSLAGGLLILVCVARLRARMGLPSPGWWPSLLAALSWLFLVGPLAHHLFFAPPQWRYITAGPNIYGHAIWVPVSGLALGAGLAVLAHGMARS